MNSFLVCHKSHLEPTSSGDVSANKLIALTIDETNQKREQESNDKNAFPACPSDQSEVGHGWAPLEAPLPGAELEAGFDTGE